MMSLVVDDDCVDIDTLIGPLPNFDSFDKFFIRKAASLLEVKSKEKLVRKVAYLFKILKNHKNLISWLNLEGNAL